MNRPPWLPLIAALSLLIAAAAGVVAVSAVVFLLVLAGFTGAMALLADRHQKR
ncbi:MAG: hypothetical protein P8Q20_08755 [Acidimicrobiales bacterium]|nr:hypothetical protein [Acidimicrobiales bacterium]